MDVVTLGAALKGAKAYTDATIAPLLGGVHYRGSVNYFNNLPSNPFEGDAYTVKYSGTSGTSPDGTEYVWALDTEDNTYKWIGFSPDTYTKSEIDNLLSGKQNTIDSTHKISADNVDDSNTTNKFVTAADKTKLDRVIMDSTETQDYYMQDSTPSSPSEGDYWFTDEPIVSADVSAMTGYAKAQTASAIAATDTLNEAVGKLEKKADDNTTGLSSKQNQVLGSWTAGTATSHVTPTGTDTVLQALQKIDNNQRNDENNILTLANQSTRYNVLNLSAAENVSVSSGITYTIQSDGSVHIEGDINVTGSALYFEKIPIATNVQYITIGCPAGGGNTSYKVQIYDNETNISNADDTGSGSEPFTITSGKIGYRIRFAVGTYDIVVKPMVIAKSLYDAGFTNYQPYAMSNAEITAWILSQS